tara:strand:- start:30 stop:428 length:399 start_codon:yes stop_codon:yes gene_type:complete
MNAQMNAQVDKHKGLIQMNKDLIAKQQFGWTLVVIGGVEEEFRGKHESMLGLRQAHLKHSEYMIRLFTCFSQKKIKELKVIYRLIKANAQDVEFYMCNTIQYGYHTEQEYIEHMDGFKAEIEGWSRLDNLRD